MSNLEADLYRTLQNVNDLTKANVATNLLNAVNSGQLAIDQNTLKQVITVVQSTIDQSTDVAHVQVLKVSDQSKTRKKPTGRTTKK
jgi:hypothetical protein